MVPALPRSRRANLGRLLFAHLGGPGTDEGSFEIMKSALDSWEALASQLDYWAERDRQYWRERKEKDYAAWLDRHFFLPSQQNFKPKDGTPRTVEIETRIEVKREMQKMRKSWRDHVGGCYLTREDFPEPEILHWIEAREEETHPPNKEPAIKWVLYCSEHQKGLVMNKVNSEFMANLTGKDNPEDWVGTVVEAFNDKTVRAPDGTYGGIRLRKPTRQEKESAKEEEKEVEEIPY